jgi:hypothetical protein
LCTIFKIISDLEVKVICSLILDTHSVSEITSLSSK